MRKIALYCALLSCAGAVAWMELIAAFDYGGNWTAFYRTGSRTKLPSIAAEERIYLLHGQGSGGYDGQYYRLIAQDPLLLHGTERLIDVARLRYRRILVPGLAWLAALGSAAAATYTYIAVVILFLGCGAYWLSLYAAVTGWSPWWGMAFVLMPAAFLSIDRLTVDIALAALTVGFALYWKTGRFCKLYFVLLLALLAKETGALLLGAYGLIAIWRREWRTAMIMSTAAAPAAIWFVYVQRHTLSDGTAWIQLPLSSVWQAMFHPELYPLRRWFIVPLDYLAWIGMLVAIVVGAVRCRKDNALALAAMFFAALAAVIDFSVWQEVEGYGRAFTPLFLLTLLAQPDRWSMLPLLLVLPRALVFPLSETLSACLKMFAR